MDRLIKTDKPVDALEETKKVDNGISSKLIDYVNKLISETSSIIKNITGQKIQTPQNKINTLQEGIAESEKLLERANNAAEKHDFETAINSPTMPRTFFYLLPKTLMLNYKSIKQRTRTLQNKVKSS